MPQLVKGGKHVFGWSLVTAGGEVLIPPEAVGCAVRGPIVDEARRHAELPVFEAET